MIKPWDANAMQCKKEKDKLTALAITDHYGC